MSGDDAETPDAKISALLPALTGDQEILDQMLLRLDMVNLLAAMVARSAKKVRAEIAADLGYGCAEPPRVGSKRPAGAVQHEVPLKTAIDPRPAGPGSCPKSLRFKKLRRGKEEVGPAAPADLPTRRFSCSDQ